jgi:hypothetical protein
MDASVYIKELLEEKEPERLQGLVNTLIRDETVQDKILTLLTVEVVSNPCLAHNLDHVVEFATICAVMLALGFESGKRAGRTGTYGRVGYAQVEVRRLGAA